MTWASHPTAEMPAIDAAHPGRHRRRHAGRIAAIGAGVLLVLTAGAAMFSPSLLGWPPPSQPAEGAGIATPPSTLASRPDARASAATPPATARATPTRTTAAPAKTTKTQPAPAATGIGALENDVIALTNAEREQNGCSALVVNPALRSAARSHSADMADKGYFNHDSLDGQDPGARMRAAGYNTDRGWAENIAYGYPTAAAVMKGWMASAGHRANILNCALHSIGVGAARASNGRLYWTQDFGGR